MPMHVVNLCKFLMIYSAITNCNVEQMQEETGKKV